MNTTRRVAVICAFKDDNGDQRSRGEIFDVMYETPKQQRAVNERITRGFLTFDLDQAQAYWGGEGKSKKGS